MKLDKENIADFPTRISKISTRIGSTCWLEPLLAKQKNKIGLDLIDSYILIVYPLIIVTNNNLIF